MTAYPNGVCYLNATMFASIKKRSAIPIKISLKTDGNGYIIILPITSLKDADSDSRKVSTRGGGGSFSCKVLAQAITNDSAKIVEFDGPMQIDADNPSGYKSTQTFNLKQQ